MQKEYNEQLALVDYINSLSQRVLEDYDSLTVHDINKIQELIKEIDND